MTTNRKLRVTSRRCGVTGLRLGSGSAARAAVAPRMDGFSVIELMVTVTVAAVLAAVAIPSMRTFLQNDRMWTEQNALVMSLNAARSEAIKQDLTNGIVVCASNDGLNCNSANWSNGWIVLSSAGGPPLQSVPAMPVSNTLKENNGRTQLVFLSNGTVQGQVTGQFTFCDQRGGGNARYTEVAAFGRIVSAPSSMPGRDLTGVALVCP